MFDKVLVLTSDGKLAYFGPVNRDLIRDVFLGKDSDPSLDSGSICDLILNSSDAPHEAAVMERFKASPTYTAMDKDLKEYTKAMPGRGIQTFLPESKYASSFLHQARVIGRRRLIMTKRNPSTYFRIIIAVVFGVIIGSLFSVLKFDFAGSLARSAYMFQVRPAENGRTQPSSAIQANSLLFYPRAAFLCSC
jgi:hypothetical protein